MDAPIDEWSGDRGVGVQYFSQQAVNRLLPAAGIEVREEAGLPERLREVPRAQRRPLAKPLADLARRYPDRREAMGRAFQTGVYSMKEIAEFFGVHYATVSRAVRRLEDRKASSDR